MIKAACKFNKNGNIKLGTTGYSFSKLAGNTEFTIEGEKIVGSCGRHCAGCWTEAIKAGRRPACYVAKSYRHPSVKIGHARNTKMFRQDIEKAFEILNKTIDRAKNKPVFVRINQSGELETVKEFLSWCDMARKNPDIKFWLYTKAFDIVSFALDRNLVPDNMTILFSIWHEYGINEFLKYSERENVKAFVYDDKTFNYAAHNINITTYCHAYDENGKLNHAVTCDKCQKCFNRILSCKVIGCFDH